MGLVNPLMPQVILDTGPLVALFNRRDTYHEWVLEQIKQISPPMLTCEAVIIEACFLLDKIDSSQSHQVFTYLDRGVINIPFVLTDESAEIQALREKYLTVPMSVADACLVRMAENFEHHLIFTLDSDFHIYRKHRHEVINCIIPANR